MSHLSRPAWGLALPLLVAAFAVLAGILAIGTRSDAAAAPQHTYQVIELGTLGGNAAFALDLNDRGQVTGNSRTSTTTLPLYAFQWDSGDMTNLGTLPGSNDFSRGYAVNARGVIVGESDNNSPRAFRWERGQLSDLGTLGGASAVAHGINDAGAIVGASSNGITSRPFIWVRGDMTDLGTIAGGLDTPGRAWDVNNRGDVAGLSRAFGVTSQATLWQTNPRGVRSMTNLGSLGDGMQFSQAFAVNNRGWAVGESVLTGSTYRAVLWRGGEIIDLGTLGQTHSRANDINARGQVVGQSVQFYGFATLGDARAFIWQNGTMTDLNDLIPAGSGWELLTAEGINEAGDIVGYGRFQGEIRSFLLKRMGP